jgi:hypothetical protein
MHRRELEGSLERDLPPPLPDGISHTGLQQPQDGAGPLLRRRYRGVVVGAKRSAEELMAELQGDPGRVAPTSLARFQKSSGKRERMAVGDEWLVRMPGPWDGPVRVIQVTPSSFRFATCDGHLEAGQIEWRAESRGDALVFEIESWARAGDRLSAVMHDHLRMAKEVQLHMWSSVVEKVTAKAGGRLERGIEIETRRVAPDVF